VGTVNGVANSANSAKAANSGVSVNGVARSANGAVSGLSMNGAAGRASVNGAAGQASVNGAAGPRSRNRPGLSADESAHERDRRAFTRMWERHYELIRRYLLKRCPPEQTEDLVQETFLRVWESRQRPLDEARLPAYLLRVARNLWIDHLRWQKNWGNVVSLSDAVIPAEHPERQLTVSLRYDSVQEAVRTLSPRRRAAFELRWLEGCSHREIAQRLQITVKTVENHLNAAYRELRGLFPEEVADGAGSPGRTRAACEEAG
jgi:RNA polymerase sigma-70 factor (ECF subfamily)